jgi:hypothetical protein
MNHQTSLKVVFTMLMALWSSTSLAFDSGRLAYHIKMGERISEYRLMSFFLMPGERLPIEVWHEDQSLQFTLISDHNLPVTSQTVVNYVAPLEPGLYRMQIVPAEQETAELLIFVMIPATEVKKGKLNGYSIGQYPKNRYKGLSIYNPPSGFTEVTKDIEDLRLSPHYRLGQFVSKQHQGFPKYVVLKSLLLRKLEFLTEMANREDLRTNGFVIMSGYRTPHYNTLIRNTVNSRHQWGGAADIYIDEDRNGVMDDLNGDGKINVKDARLLAEVVENSYQELVYRSMTGGLGIYKENKIRGPFIHVDVRGFKARW